MAKDTRQVVSAIRLPGAKGDKGAFVKGALITDPDELVAAATNKQVNLQALYDAGRITGDWKGIKKRK